MKWLSGLGASLFWVYKLLYGSISKYEMAAALGSILSSRDAPLCLGKSGFINENENKIFVLILYMENTYSYIFHVILTLSRSV